MSLFTLYLITMLPSMGTAFTTLGVLSIIVFGVWALIVFIEDVDEYKRLVIKYLKISFFVLFIGVLIPTNDALKYIIGGYVITNIEGIEKLPKNLIKYANTILEEEVGDVKKVVTDQVRVSREESVYSLIG